MLLTTTVSSPAKPMLVIQQPVAKPIRNSRERSGPGRLVNVTRLPALAAEQLTGERPILKVPSLPRARGAREETRGGRYNRVCLLPEIKRAPLVKQDAFQAAQQGKTDTH